MLFRSDDDEEEFRRANMQLIKNKSKNRYDNSNNSNNGNSKRSEPSSGSKKRIAAGMKFGGGQRISARDTLLAKAAEANLFVPAEQGRRLQQYQQEGQQYQQHQQHQQYEHQPQSFLPTQQQQQTFNETIDPLFEAFGTYAAPEPFTYSRETAAEETNKKMLEDEAIDDAFF